MSRSQSSKGKINNESIEFINLTTHQLQTPLAVLRAQLNMINHGDYGEVPVAWETPLSRLQHSTEQMKEMVEVMLKTMRLSTGHFVPQMQSIEVINFLKQQVDEITPFATENKIQLHQQYDLSSIEVYTEPHLLKDVINTFLHNAIKYSPGGGDVHLSAFSEGNTLKFSISDNGIGIPEDEQKELFSQYFRATNANRSAIPGTGLGLYHARLCAKQLGADIGYLPNLPSGSIFWLRIKQANN